MEFKLTKRGIMVKNTAGMVSAAGAGAFMAYLITMAWFG